LTSGPTLICPHPKAADMCISNAYGHGMLSTKKIGMGSWLYYSNQVQHGACEYFLGVGGAPGRWYGRGLDALGLEPKAVVSERELETLFGRALHPGTRRQLGRGWRADGITGYDLCFSAPKSVSVLWALGEDTVPHQVADAHRAAVASALAYLDSHTAFSRVGTDGRAQVSTDGFAAAVFPHRTSRAGEPQLHSHALVVNKVRCPDGEWRTIDGHEIYAHKKSAGVVYQAVLRNELTRRLGVAWTPVTKDGQAASPWAGDFPVNVAVAARRFGIPVSASVNAAAW
jgi:conjugative relaxase-like TrwC/TraI family protein